MKKELFEELLQSVGEAVEIRQGKRRPTRVHSVEVIDCRAVRARVGLSQREFADFLGVSVHTLRNWEQGRRVPEGAARALLRVAWQHPAAVRFARLDRPPSWTSARVPVGATAVVRHTRPPEPAGNFRPVRAPRVSWAGGSHEGAGAAA